MSPIYSFGHHLPARRVRVHTNRHRIKRGEREVWSVLDATSGRLIEHRASIMLTNCKLHVQPGGLRRVQEGGKRTVFAWVEGYVVTQPDAQLALAHSVTFNPHTDTEFMCAGRAIKHAPFIEFRPDLQVLAPWPRI